jgi:thiosulfate dehydrogenase [quinone] large subunit
MAQGTHGTGKDALMSTDDREAMMTALRERAGHAGWILLPLRAFLAIVYLYGGISKVADNRFLDASSPRSMHSSVLAIKSTSPIGGLLGPVLDHSFAFGLLMALAEFAVGLGVLLGLWTRVAAAGGMVLALSLWLTVSWGAVPWFTSADLVFLFAFTPLLIAGSAGVLSMDGWLASAALAHPGRSEDHTRRTLVTGAAGVGALVVLGAASLGRKSTAAKQAAPAGSSAPSNAVLINASEVPVGGGKQVTDPVSGDPTWVLQLTSGQFTAYDAVCPHQGCPVQFVSTSDGFSCPCHGSHFSSTGKLEGGPAARGLGVVNVQLVDGVVKRT